MSEVKQIRITHRPSGELIAEGPLGWGIKPFEGNYYIQRRYLKTKGFKVNFIPGLCIYKFLYVWLDFSFGSTGCPIPYFRLSGIASLFLTTIRNFNSN